MKIKTLRLSIPEPCHEDWNNMTPTLQGRYCQACEKEVTDFSQMTDAQIVQLIEKGKGNYCGRFRPEQLDRDISLSVPQYVLSPWAKAGILAASVLLAVPGMSQQTRLSTKPAAQVTLVTPEKEVGSNTPFILKGTVTDQEGEPLIAASILLVGTSSGTVTDLDGHFTMRIEQQLPNLALTFSYIGYEAKTITVTGRPEKRLKVKLEEGVILPSAVIVGYGVTRVRKTMGGPISIVRASKKTEKTEKRVKKWEDAPIADIKIFPNPFVSNIKLIFGDLAEGEYALRIFSNNGQEVHQRKTHLSAFQEMELDLANLNLPAASYWLHITNAKGKVFKQQLMKINR